MKHAIANYGIANWRTTEPTLYDSPWNWKVMVDNFMESYHHVGIHSDALQTLVPASGTYADNCDGPFAILHNPTKGRGPMLTTLPVSPALTRTSFRSSWSLQSSRLIFSQFRPIRCSTTKFSRSRLTVCVANC